MIRVISWVCVATLLCSVMGCGGGAEDPGPGPINVGGTDDGGTPSGTTPEETSSGTPSGTTPSGTTPSGATPSGTSAPSEDGWGDLSGRFVLDGDVPPRDKVDITKDVAFCGPFNLLDESLIVNSKDKGIKNVVVYLYTSSGEEPPTPHESYNEMLTSTVTLDNEKCRFEPRIRLLLTTQKLHAFNKDAVAHNINVATTKSLPQNPSLPPNTDLVMQPIDQAERLPVTVSCAIHPWMTARLVVRDSPYFAVSDDSGNFSIPKLPAGEWTFVAWQEKVGYIKETKFDGNEIKRGRFTVTISGDKDLGEIKVPAAIFQDE